MSARTFVPLAPWQGSSGQRQGSTEASQGRPGALQESTSPLTAPELPCIKVPCALDEIGHTHHALRALPVLGITAPVDERFRCVLPGHEDREPSAAIRWDARARLWKYHDRHHERFGSEAWLRLCDVRAALATGEVRWLKNGESALWYLRLWADAGLIEPVHVELPQIAREPSAELLAVAEGFRLLVGLRLLRGDHKPTPFGYRLVGPWCGLSTRTANRALKRLLELRVIEKVGERPTGFGKHMALYAPGVVGGGS